MTGNVGKPGVYPLSAPTTVLQMLATAGGLLEYAKAKDIRVMRTENGKTVSLKFNYKDVSPGQEPAAEHLSQARRHPDRSVTMKLLPIILSASVLLAAPAAAQMAPPRAERPYRGLFGGGVGNAEQLLDVNMSLGGGYDDNVLADTAGVGDLPVSGPNQGTASTFTSVSGDLGYQLTRMRFGINASAAAQGRYHPDVESTKYISSQSGSVAAFAQLAKSTRLGVDHTTSHQPYLSLRLFPPLFEVPGDALPPPQEYGVRRTDYFSHNSSIEFTQGLGRRTSLSLNYGYRREDLAGDERDLLESQCGWPPYLSMEKGSRYLRRVPLHRCPLWCERRY